VKHDHGFSPSPFQGYCTLACWKPLIRKRAKVGDSVLSTSPKSDDLRDARGHEADRC